MTKSTMITTIQEKELDLWEKPESSRKSVW